MESLQHDIWTASVERTSRQRSSLHSRSLLLGLSGRQAIHVIEHGIVHCDDVMRCDCMPLRHPQGPISEWPQHFPDILHNGPFILGCAGWPVIAVFWVFKPHAGEFTQSECALEQLHGVVPMCLHIHNRKYHNADFGFRTVNQLISTTKC